MPKNGKRKEDWKRTAQNMRQEARGEYTAPTYTEAQLQDPNAQVTAMQGMNNPAHPHNRAGLADKLAYRSAGRDLQNFNSQLNAYQAFKAAPPGTMDPNTYGGMGGAGQGQFPQGQGPAPIPPGEITPPIDLSASMPGALAGAGQSVGGSISGNSTPLFGNNPGSSTIDISTLLGGSPPSGGGAPYTPPQSAPMAYGYQYGSPPGRRRRRRP